MFRLKITEPYVRFNLTRKQREELTPEVGRYKGIPEDHFLCVFVILVWLKMNLIFYFTAQLC